MHHRCLSYSASHKNSVDSRLQSVCDRSLWGHALAQNNKTSLSIALIKLFHRAIVQKRLLDKIVYYSVGQTR